MKTSIPLVYIERQLVRQLSSFFLLDETDYDLINVKMGGGDFTM